MLWLVPAGPPGLSGRPHAQTLWPPADCLYMTPVRRKKPAMGVLVQLRIPLPVPLVFNAPAVAD